MGSEEEVGSEEKEKNGLYHTRPTRENLTRRIMMISSNVPSIARARAFWIAWPSALGLSAYLPPSTASEEVPVWHCGW